MAIYEYECDRGHTLELIRRMDARDDPVECLVCLDEIDPVWMEDRNADLPILMMTRRGLETSNVKVKTGPTERQHPIGHDRRGPFDNPGVEARGTPEEPT